MLEFVLGGSGSGKTTLLYQKMKERALAGQKSILLVPEQFTASTEARIYHQLGDAYSGMVESFSFTSLAERVLTTCGGSAVKTLSEAGRAVLVRRAMKELQDSLTYYRKQRQNAAFCQMVAQTIDELKSAGISAMQLSQLAEQCGGGRDKIADLALIYAAYQAGVQETELDPTDRVNLAAQQLTSACNAGETPMFLQGRSIFIDEFDTFNAPKKNLLRALFAAQNTVMVALCADGMLQTGAAEPTHKPTFLEDVSLFSGARRVAFDLRTLARKEGVGIAAPIVLQQDLRHAQQPKLCALNDLLSGNQAGVEQWKNSLAAQQDATQEVVNASGCVISHDNNQDRNKVTTQEMGEETVQNAPDDSLVLFGAKNREEEACAMAAEMQRLVRGGASYGEMAIVCRNLEQYRTVVQRECRLAEIPLFCDETTTPTFSAPVTAIRALLSILRGVDYTDQMIALAKTGLCAAPQKDENGKTILVAIPEHQILALENYVYTWSPSRATWQTPFTRNPNGFGEQGDVATQTAEQTTTPNANLAIAAEQQQGQQLNQQGGQPTQLGEQQATQQDALQQSAPMREPAAETARKALLAPIQTLCNRTNRKSISATVLTKEIYQCLQALGAEQQQAVQVAAMRKVSGIPASEAAAREWNVVMELLDQMVRLLGDEEITITEYAELFLLLLNTTDLGHIPQNVDAVIFTSAGKMRLAAPKYVFVLGLAEGEFPALPGGHGLLNDADRDALMAQNIELPDCFENKMVREDICFYKALTAPSCKLWLSWPQGLALPVTSALAPVIAQLAPLQASFDVWQSATTPAAAIDRLGSIWGEDNVQAASLYQALQQTSAQANTPWGGALSRFNTLAEDAPKQLQNPVQVGQLLGNTLAVSPSKVEKYYTCQYAYFLQYLLRLRPRQKAELSPNHSGSLMHWVLEKALTTKPTPYDEWKPVPFVELTEAQLCTLAQKLTQAYQQLYMPDDTVRFGYLMTRLTKSMVALFLYLQQELKQSAFTPAACEVSIGQPEFPAPEYQLETGEVIKLIGVIDRIDTWQDAGGTVWMRVVDYKTGEKTFRLKEVYDGLDCQMLLYLFAALKQWQAPQAGKKKAAGVQYLLADPAPKSQDRTAAATPLRPSIEGMLSANEAVIKASDAAFTGEYLPFAIKDGKIDARTQKARLADDEKMERIEKHLDQLVLEMAQGLYQGCIKAEPLCPSATKTPCAWCEFRSICCHEDGKGERGLTAKDDPFEADAAQETAEKGTIQNKEETAKKDILQSKEQIEKTTTQQTVAEEQ